VRAGVPGDRLGDGVRAARGHPLDALAHGRVVAQVGLEDQPEGALVRTVAVDEVEVGTHRRCHAQAVVRRGGQRLADSADQALGVLVEQRQVELQLAREVLVEHGLADAGPSAMSSMAAAW
jgi:hypothetical protein